MTWELYLPEVIGVWNKRDCPGGEFKCLGAVFTDGKKFQFIPKDVNLNAVEAEQV